MPATRVIRRRTREPKIVVTEPRLATLLVKDHGHFCAKCRELDLVTELPTADAVVKDLIDAIQDYAEVAVSGGASTSRADD